MLYFVCVCGGGGGVKEANTMVSNKMVSDNCALEFIFPVKT